MGGSVSRTYGVSTLVRDCRTFFPAPDLQSDLTHARTHTYTHIQTWQSGPRSSRMPCTVACRTRRRKWARTFSFPEGTTALSILRNCYSLISVSFLSLRRLTWVINSIRSFIAQQCHYSTSLARGSVERRRHAVIMLRSFPTPGSSSLAGSTDTTSSTTYTSSTSPLLRISPR